MSEVSFYTRIGDVFSDHLSPAVLLRLKLFSAMLLGASMIITEVNDANAVNTRRDQSKRQRQSNLVHHHVL